jgi:predicted NACHT family NTPase
MTRNVRKLSTPLRGKDPDTPLAFSEFSQVPHLILLGEAGSGKTHLFREQATEEKAAYVTARAFLNVPANKIYGQSLYIDGLDERRAGRGDRDTIDDIVGHLFEVEPKRVRISCRIADWLGETDLAALNTYFIQSSEPVVVVLEALSHDEQVEVLGARGAQATSALEFLAEAKRRGLDDFLSNPQNLLMLWAVAKDGIWPANRGGSGKRLRQVQDFPDGDRLIS